MADRETIIVGEITREKLESAQKIISKRGISATFNNTIAIVVEEWLEKQDQKNAD